MSTPANLTPDRIDAMLSRVAEACMVGIDEAEARMKTAEDAEAFERTTRALQTVCRNLRQTIALKQRFDRDQITLAAERRGEAEVLQQEAARVRDAAVTRRHAEVRRRIGPLIWSEYEADDVREVLGDVDAFLRDMAKEDDFLDISIEAQLERLTEQFAPPEDDEDEDEAPEAQAAEAPEPPPPPEPPSRPPDPLPGAAYPGELIQRGQRRPGSSGD